jgi:hypothetical protein
MSKVQSQINRCKKQHQQPSVKTSVRSVVEIAPNPSDAVLRFTTTVVKESQTSSDVLTMILKKFEKVQIIAPKTKPLVLHQFFHENH